MLNIIVPTKYYIFDLINHKSIFELNNIFKEANYAIYEFL
jgi:hypothetical protein